MTREVVINLLKDMICDYPRRYALLIKTDSELLNYINENTPLLKDKFYDIGTKVHWIIYGLTDFPRCAVCGEKLTNKNVSKFGYDKTCSEICTHIQKDTVLRKRLYNKKRIKKDVKLTRRSTLKKY